MSALEIDDIIVTDLVSAATAFISANFRRIVLVNHKKEWHIEVTLEQADEDDFLEVLEMGCHLEGSIKWQSEHEIELSKVIVDAGDLPQDYNDEGRRLVFQRKESKGLDDLQKIPAKQIVDISHWDALDIENMMVVIAFQCLLGRVSSNLDWVMLIGSEGKWHLDVSLIVADDSDHQEAIKIGEIFRKRAAAQLKQEVGQTVVLIDSIFDVEESTHRIERLIYRRRSW